MRRLLAALWVLGCGGGLPPVPCSPDGTGGSGEGFFDGGFAGGAGGFAGQPETVYDTGKPAMVTLSLQASLCGDQKLPATSVTTTVVGPDNLPVDQTNDGPNNGANETDPYTTVVTFTPQQAGDYHLTARFEPNLGIVQFDLRAAADLTAVAVQATYPAALVPNCGSFSVTDFGTLLCLDSSHGLHVLRSGAAVERIEADLFSVGGNIVWAFSSATTQVTAYVDMGTGSLAAGTPIALSAPPYLIVPLDSGVLLGMSETVLRYVPSNGAYTNDKTWTLPTLAQPTAAAMTGDEMLVFSDNQLLATFGTDPMFVTLSQQLQSMGFGPEGIWIFDGNANLLELYQPGQHAPVASAPPPFPESWQTTDELQYGDAPSTSGSDSLFASFDPSTGITFANWGPLQSKTAVTHGWAVFDSGMDVVVKKRPTP